MQGTLSTHLRTSLGPGRSGFWVLIFLLVTVAMTWPLARNLGSAIPENLGDPLLNVWILGWGSQRILGGFSGFWDAPIFHPYAQTYAYSEHLLGITPFVAPVYWLTGNPVLAYNAAFVTSYVLAALGVFLLVRAITGRRDAAVVAALAFAFSPYRTGGQIARLQVLMSGWFPLALLALHRYFATGERRALAGAAAAYLIGGLANVYYLYYMPLALGLVAAHGVLRLVADRRRALIDLAVAAAIVAVLLAPILYPYYAVQRDLGLRRTVDENVTYSADVSSYLHVWTDAPAERWLPQEESADRGLFQGVTIVVLAAIGLAAGLRRRSVAPDASMLRLPPRQVARLYGGMGLAAFLLSLGPQPTAWRRSILPHGPYTLLMWLVPGFDGLRVPARFAVIVSLSLAVLGGIGMARMLAARSRGTRLALVALASCLVLAEGYRQPPLRAFDWRMDEQSRQAYGWVRNGPAGAILELPFADITFRRRPAAGETPALFYQYATLWHGRAMVNGTSGFASPLADFLQGSGSPFVDADGALAAIEALWPFRVRFVVIHVTDFADESIGRRVAESLAAMPHLVAARQTFGGIEVLMLHDPPAPPPMRAPLTRAIQPSGLRASVAQDALPLAADDDLTTHWATIENQTSSEWIELEFDRALDIGAVRITMGAFVGQYPRHLVIDGVSDDGEVSRLFDGSVVPPLVRGLLATPDAPIHLDLPPNRSRRLRLTQTGRSGLQPWAIPEIVVEER